ncbi:MAG: DnaA ATPase domain-containing protein [Thermoanaerobaculia bacterium]
MTAPRTEISTRCRGCGAELRLSAEVGPTSIGGRFGRALAALGVTCPACTADAERAEREQAARRLLSDRIQRSGLPGELCDLGFSEMQREGRRGQAVQAASEWALGARQLVFCYGPVGTGKTRLAATACWRRLQRTPVSWVSVAAYIAKTRDFEGGGAAATARLAQSAADVVLDDLDKVKPTEWAVEQLYALVEGRITKGAAVFVTANRRPSQLGPLYGESLMSRLAAFSQFEMDGPDRRIPTTTQENE